MSPILLPPSLVLRGAEVLLRPLTMNDAAALAAAADEGREHYGFSSVPDGPDGAREFIARALRQRDAGRRLPFTIVWRGRVVGSTGYSDYQTWEWPAGSPRQRAGRPDVVEIGYTWLAASAQRTRCNTESKYLLLAHAFEAWDVHRASFRTDERNQRSRRAIERLGARFEGVRLADAAAADGTVRNSAYYSIPRADWPAVRERLTRLLARPEEAGGISPREA